MVRAVQSVVRFFLDGATESPFMRHGLVVAELVFGRIPALVLVLGAYQGWLVMPSYPLPVGDVGDALRVVSLVLALWTLSGLFWPVLGVVMFLVFGYLCFAYGIAGIDAIPVLASAFIISSRRRGLAASTERSSSGCG